MQLLAALVVEAGQKVAENVVVAFALGPPHYAGLLQEVMPEAGANQLTLSSKLRGLGGGVSGVL